MTSPNAAWKVNISTPGNNARKIIHGRCPACVHVERTGIRETVIPHRHRRPRSRTGLVLLVLFASMALFSWVAFFALLVWGAEWSPVWRAQAISFVVTGTFTTYFTYLTHQERNRSGSDSHER